MLTFTEKLLARIFNNPFGRLYLGVPKGKKIYKITKSSAHYYTGEIAEDGMPLICTGETFPGGIKLFNKFQFAGKFFGVFSVLVLTKFVGEHGLLSLFALTDTGAKAPTSTGAGYNNYTNPTNAYANDGSYTTYAFGNYGGQSYGTFGFSIASGNNIKGVEAVIKHKVSTANANLGLNLYWYGSWCGSSVDKPLGSSSTTDITETIGGSTDLWGVTNPAYNNFTNNTSFQISWYSYNNYQLSITHSVDYLTVKVYYSAPVSSASPSLSPSTSKSPSLSPSTSTSPSPSPGFEQYTRFHYAVLPSDDADLTTGYSTQDYTDVTTKDGVFVDQDADSGSYMIHQFKDFVGTHTSCQLEAWFKTTEDTGTNPAVLQIYNHTNNPTWDTVTSDTTTTAGTYVHFLQTIADLTSYKNGGNVISCRIYQKSI